LKIQLILILKKNICNNISNYIENHFFGNTSRILNNIDKKIEEKINNKVDEMINKRLTIYIDEKIKKDRDNILIMINNKYNEKINEHKVQIEKEYKSEFDKLDAFFKQHYLQIKTKVKSDYGKIKKNWENFINNYQYNYLDYNENKTISEEINNMNKKNKKQIS